MKEKDSNPLVGIVGPCKSGKSTLVNALIPFGYNVKQIAQEHSFVPQMWEVLTKPVYLVYLDVNYENTKARSDLNWKLQDYEEQLIRLKHAREHADLTVDTNQLSEKEVQQIVISFIQKKIQK